MSARDPSPKTVTDDDLESSRIELRPSQPSSRPPRKPAAEAELSAGTHVERYVVLYRLGKGGMGVVYAAYDPQLDRKVAIKVHRRRPSDDVDASQGRMLREAQALAKLNHPNVVGVHDTGLVKGQVFVAMDFVEGDNLRQWLRAKPRPRAEIIDKIIQAAAGLAAAHKAGIVHRDFKPDNAIVGVDGRVRVLDFGLARVHAPSFVEEHVVIRPGAPVKRDAPLVPPRVDAPPSEGSEASTRQAGRGKAAGTPAYMSPEQQAGEDVGPAADQFALCVTLYESLCGRLPWPPSPTAMRDAIRAGEILEPPRHSPLPRWLRRIIWRGLSVDPSARFDDLAALVAELSRRRGRRRRWWASVAAGSVSLGALALLVPRDAPPEPCAEQDAQVRLGDAWDESRRAEVAQAFDASTRPWATHARERVQAGLDHWASRWTEAHLDACRATHVHHEQSELMLDLRMECLQRKRDALDALTQLLSRADDAVIDRALVAVQSLPSVTPCADAPALRERLPPPDDASVREELDELSVRVAHASALQFAGKLDEAIDTARSVSERASQLDWAPLSAESSYRLGSALEVAGKFDEAEAALVDAALAAEVARDDRQLADARSMLVMVVGDRLGRTREGHTWARLAEASIARAGGDTALLAALEYNLALVLDHESPPEEVLSHQVRALELAQQAGLHELRLASFHNTLAATLAQVGRHEEGLQHAGIAYEMFQRQLGAEHVDTATALATKGYIYDDQGRFEEGLKVYEEALAITEHALGPDNPHVATILGNLAIAAAQSGDLPRAIDSFRRVVDIDVATLGEEHASTARALANLASALKMDGRFEDALATHQRAYGIRRRLYGDDHLQVASSHAGIAAALETLDRLPEARPHRDAQLRTLARVFGDDHPELSRPLANLAHTQLLLGETQTGLQTAKRAIALTDSPQIRDDERAFVRAVLARALAEGGEAASAREALATARTELGDTASPETQAVFDATDAALR